MRYLILILFCFNYSFLLAQPCPKYGNAKTADKRKLNTLKNAGVNINPSRIPEFLPLKNLINSKKRNDRKLYLDGAYVVTEGYLISYEEKGRNHAIVKKRKPI